MGLINPRSKVQVLPPTQVENSVFLSYNRCVCGSSSTVERRPVTAEVAGSAPVSRAYKIEKRAKIRYSARVIAEVAQLVEQLHGKEQVAGSIPAFGSRFIIGSSPA